MVDLPRSLGRNYIDGQWVEPDSIGTAAVVNPATEEMLAEIPSSSAADADRAIVAACRAQAAWAATPVAERAELLRRVAAILNSQREEIAQLSTAELGSPIALSRLTHVDSPVSFFTSTADLIEASALQDEEIANARIVREPYGVVGAITPWNYPLHQSAAKIAPALAAGNTVAYKPSQKTPLSAYALSEAIAEAGIPAGVFNLVVGSGPVVGARLSAHPDVDFVSFTGSTHAGTQVAAAAAATVKRVSLELGSKSPAVILPGTDLSTTLEQALRAGFVNSGQTCMALTRILVDRSELEQVEAIIPELVSAYTVGDPVLDTTEYGPLASNDQYRRVIDYICLGIDEGDRLLVGGTARPEGLDTGYYVPLTVFSGVKPDSPLVHEEIFGPVLVIQTYESAGEAVELANDTPYGLCAGVWAPNTNDAVAVARRIQAGQVFINGGRFNPAVPFGGYKQSGVGREYGKYGLEEFQQVKALVF